MPPIIPPVTVNQPHESNVITLRNGVVPRFSLHVKPKEAKMSRNQQRYSPEFREHVANLAYTYAWRSVSSLANEFGLHPSTVAKWVRENRSVTTPMVQRPPLNEAEYDELILLRRKVQNFKEMRDYFVEATTYVSEIYKFEKAK